MNPTTEPSRPSFSGAVCDRHPDEQFTGFCPLCLFERLTVLDTRKSTATTTTTTSTSAAGALKSLFKPSQKPSFFSELRRTQSFSASSKREGFSGVFEPQRKSCDVKVRSTLWTLFNRDDERKKEPEEVEDVVVGCSSSSFIVEEAVIETKEEEEEEEEEEYYDDVEAEIRVSADRNVVNVDDIREDEIVEEAIGEEIKENEEVKTFTMKDHIDLHSQSKKASSGRDFKEIAGSFWSAASVFSKKLQKWRQNQKMKKQRSGRRGGGGGSSALPVDKPIGRQYRETQSEIADYGFGRRSCDTDPRFSLDAGRMSFDDPRYSFDEPRASWDGYLIGKTMFPRLTPMLSVVEDAPVHHVPRIDAQILMEEPRVSVSMEPRVSVSMEPRVSVSMEPRVSVSNNGDDTVPGGSVQTRDYYSDSSSKRRKSFERSNSIRKTAAAVVADIEEMKSVLNVKVSPKRDSNSNSNSLRDDCSETFEIGLRDNASIMNNVDKKEHANNKKSRRWSKAWNIWGLIHWRGGTKYEDDDRFSRVNGVGRSFSESWQDLPSEQNRKILRSSSSVSWRNSNGIGSSFNGSARKSNVETNGHSKKKKDEFVLERNRSARYSPSHVDNGMLRFYLTPMRSSWRSASTGKNRANNAHSIARSVLRLY